MFRPTIPLRTPRRYDLGFIRPTQFRVQMLRIPVDLTVPARPVNFCQGGGLYLFPRLKANRAGRFHIAFITPA